MGLQNKDEYNYSLGYEVAESHWRNTYSRVGLDWHDKVTLDFGCHWGYLSLYQLENLGVAEAHGVDLTPHWEKMVEIWPNWDHDSIQNLHLHSGDLRKIGSLRDKTFDIITSTGTLMLLEHSHLEQTLLWFFDHLEPGGFAILRTRTFFSHIGGDLHNLTNVPLAHIIFPGHVIDKFATEKIAWRPRGQEILHSNGYPRYMNPMTASSYAMLSRRVGFELVELVRHDSHIGKEEYSRFDDKLWYFDERDLRTGEITLFLRKPEVKRNLSELEA